MFLLTIQKFNNGNPTATSILGYENLESVTGAMFSTLASSVANTDIEFVCCMIINEYGNTLKHESWARERVNVVNESDNK